MNKRLVRSTAGVMLDPFSVMMSGAVRRTILPKSKVVKDGHFDILHGEAKYKQAFINACHFAETMTVVGPVAQLDWGSTPDPTVNAAYWKAPTGLGENEAFFANLKAFASRNSAILKGFMENTIAAEGGGHLVHVMPDCTLSLPPQDAATMRHKFHKSVMKHIYDEGFVGSYNDYYCRGDRNSSIVGRFPKGAPVVALMAVMFSFKKPYGSLASNELTNLGGWPPVCFLMPVVVPGGTSVDSWGSSRSVRDNTIATQPSLMTYQIRLRDKDVARRRTVPFGQPFKLTSVNKWGKPPDTMRSLSDVFKALWSQATQYCAWNLMVDWEPGSFDEKIPRKHVAELALDPLGAGRRIRGHNRYASKFDVEGLSMLWEHKMAHRDTDELPFPLAWNEARTGHVMEPVRTQAEKGDHRKMIFVLPSYFDESIQGSLMSTAWSLLRFGVSGKGRLSDFLDGSLMQSATPTDARDPERVLNTGGQISMADRARAHFHPVSAPDVFNNGALPVHAVRAEMAFDPEGTPQVWGMSTPRDTPFWNDDATMDELTKGVETLEGFKFTEAFCSNSTRGLTEAFEKVKKSSVAKDGSGLVDGGSVIDLFDVSDDDELM